MLPNSFAQLIDSHWQEIVAGTIRRVRTEEDVPHMQELSDRELLSWARRIQEALKAWGVAGDNENLAIEYKELGRLRFERSIPLYEVVRCLHILKVGVIGLVRNHAFAQNSREIYAQEEFERHLGLFFDWLLYNLARGYDDARRRAA